MRACACGVRDKKAVDMKAEILMAVYNGEKYLAQQLESIARQSCTDWKLTICDDASTDGTMITVRQFARRFPDKVRFFVNPKNSGSPKANFFSLIRNSDADVIFTCDQDDVWEEDKLELTLKAFEGVDKPLLVHTDMSVTDENGGRLFPSMIKKQHIDVSRTAINQLIVQNVVTGCTMAFNKELKALLAEPELVPVHDWWIAAVAALYGEIVFIDKCTVRYRKHNNNVCGPQDMSSPAYLRGRALDKKRAVKMLELGYIMALELLEKYELPPDTERMLKAYSAMPQKSKLGKLAVVSKYGIWKSGVTRKLGQLLYM